MSTSTKGEGSMFEGFAGTTKGSFFEAPSWVDQRNIPGNTSQRPALENNPNWLSLLSGKFLFFSPNLVWLGVALFDYFVFPYNYETAREFNLLFALELRYRLAVNVGIVFGYFGFWHVTLYWLHWGKRPFEKNRVWKWSKVIHNMWYTFLGCVQWTAWEAVFMHCYATDKLPFKTDKETLTSMTGSVEFVAWFFIIPLYREFHFYFAHRFIHIRFNYKYMHSLHHRNTDIEPFSGLCMHPIEHMYYFSCVGPALYLTTTPFGFLWNGVHLLISPAASHSGYEDNFQSDQFHYLHHKYFECNYGTGTFPFDMWFGTFQDKLKPKKATMGQMKTKVVQTTDAKATLLGLPKWDQAVYDVICCMSLPALLFCATTGIYDVTMIKISGFLGHKETLAVLISAGPAMVGIALTAATTRNPFKNLKKTFLWPFHKKPIFSSHEGLFFLVGFLVSVVPVYHTVIMLLSDLAPQQ